eukprot:6199244-Pleurochrysis_carterae.AAC.1
MAKKKELAAAQASSSDATAAEESVTAKHDKLKHAVGIISGYDKVLDALFRGNATKAHAIKSWSKKSKKFVHWARMGFLLFIRLRRQMIGVAICGQNKRAQNKIYVHEGNYIRESFNVLSGLARLRVLQLMQPRREGWGA